MTESKQAAVGWDKRQEEGITQDRGKLGGEHFVHYLDCNDSHTGVNIVQSLSNHMSIKY